MTPQPPSPKSPKKSSPHRPTLPKIASTIEVRQISPDDPYEAALAGLTGSEADSDAHRKKRRSAGSIDLTYRYHEPSDDELSWTEDEHGTRRRRKSNKRKSGGGDDFKTGIIPVEGKKKRRRRRSGQSAQDGDEDQIYSGGETDESESDESDNVNTSRRRRTSGKSDDFRTGIVPREGKARKKRRSLNGKGDAESEYSSESDEDEEGDQETKAKRRRSKKRVSGKSDDFKTGIPHVEGRRRKKRKSGANEDANDKENDSPVSTRGASHETTLPELGDGWTNVEWTILEHTHDHIRSLGGQAPEKIDATELAEAFLKIYETSELKLQAEKEGKERKEFSKAEVRDRIIALRKTRDRRKSGDLPPAKTLASPASIRSQESTNRRFSGLLQLAKFW